MIKKKILKDRPPASPSPNGLAFVYTFSGAARIKTKSGASLSKTGSDQGEFATPRGPPPPPPMQDSAVQSAPNVPAAAPVSHPVVDKKKPLSLVSYSSEDSDSDIDL